MGRAPGTGPHGLAVWLHFAGPITQHCAALTQQHLMLRGSMRSPVMKLEAARLASATTPSRRGWRRAGDHLLRGFPPSTWRWGRRSTWAAFPQHRGGGSRTGTRGGTGSTRLPAGSAGGGPEARAGIHPPGGPPGRRPGGAGGGPGGVGRQAMTGRGRDGRVEIFEVGPRDGLQNEARRFRWRKIALVDCLGRAGFRRIRCAGFHRSKWVPQMAGSAEVWRNRRVPGVPTPP